MPIDFYALILQEFGPEKSPFKVDQAAFRKLEDDLRAAMVRYLMARSRGSKKRAAEVSGFNRSTIAKICRRHGIPGLERGGAAMKDASHV